MLFGVLLGVGAASAADLAPGAKAPDFALPGSDGREHRLADYVGKQGVALAWFPKAFTPG
jgi:peroxiredoxin Q/BCP